MKTIETDTTLTHFEEIEWPIIVTKPNITITIDSDMSIINKQMYFVISQNNVTINGKNNTLYIASESDCGSLIKTLNNIDGLKIMNLNFRIVNNMKLDIKLFDIEKNDNNQIINSYNLDTSSKLDF